MSIKNIESIKIGVALRVSRAALGINQTELAALIGISKVTLARVETLESSLKSDALMKAIKVFRECGLELDTMSSDGINLNICEAALKFALDKLEDNAKRRPDRKLKKSYHCQ
jgi:transcriptional regulator with XRE-family HTH domain